MESGATRALNKDNAKDNDVHDGKDKTSVRTNVVRQMRWEDGV